MVKPIRRSLARRLGHNIGDRRRDVGLTQEQLAEYIEIARPDRHLGEFSNAGSNHRGGGQYLTALGFEVPQGLGVNT